MYIDYYGFREHPFQVTPDARLFYASSVHSRAYAHLMYGLAQREGFVVVTGEVGAGKTTLIERFCAELDPSSFAVARIMTTQVSGDDLLRLVADAFGAPAEGDKAVVLRGVIARLRAAERRHLLIVDEAQALPHAALEELRMLSNVTDGGRALLQTILMGQPQLRQLMASPDLDQLRQRVLASYHLGGLSREETHAYVEHRLRAVGWTGTPTWEDRALDLVYRFSGGIPRRINRLCSRVLLGGALEHSAALTASLVEATALELEEDLGGGPDADLQEAGRRALLRQRQTARRDEEIEAALDALVHRIEGLERAVARRERVFNRLMDLFAGTGGFDR
jgi:putative secretion ATPase (PEP-CTERM system associated)